MGRPTPTARTQADGSLVLAQAFACVTVGAVLILAPPVAMAGVVVWMALLWFFRATAGLLQTLLVEPGRWATRGLVVVLHLGAALLVVKAVLPGTFPVGQAIVLYVGLKAGVAGVVQLSAAARDSRFERAFLGVVDITAGAVFAVVTIGGIELPASALGWVVFCAGLASMYSFASAHRRPPTPADSPRKRLDAHREG